MTHCPLIGTRSLAATSGRITALQFLKTISNHLLLWGSCSLLLLCYDKQEVAGINFNVGPSMAASTLSWIVSLCNWSEKA